MHRLTVSAIGAGVPPGDLATNSTAIRLRISCHRDAESRCCARPRSRLPPSGASMTRTAIARLGLVVVLVGCLAVVRPEAKREGDLLLASGFETRAADTPERIRHLESLPPLRMVRHVEDGRVVFAMADPYSCKCIYVGDPQAYATYRQRAIHWEVGDEQTQEDMDDEGAGFDRGVWAPW